MYSLRHWTGAWSVIVLLHIVNIHTIRASVRGVNMDLQRGRSEPSILWVARAWCSYGFHNYTMLRWKLCSLPWRCLHWHICSAALSPDSACAPDGVPLPAYQRFFLKNVQQKFIFLWSFYNGISRLRLAKSLNSTSRRFFHHFTRSEFSVHRFVADDTRLLKQVFGHKDSEELQKDLASVIKWAKENSMTLHEDKFEVMIHKHCPQSLLYELPFTICEITYTVTSGNILCPVDQLRDLGG